jgi:hypothetical protein
MHSARAVSCRRQAWRVCVGRRIKQLVFFWDPITLFFHLSSIKVGVVMSLAPVSLRSISGLVGTSSLVVMSRPQDTSRLTRLSSTCCYLTNPACLESLSCLVSPPELASRTETLSGISRLSNLSVSLDERPCTGFTSRG